MLDGRERTRPIRYPAEEHGVHHSQAYTWLGDTRSARAEPGERTLAAAGAVGQGVAVAVPGQSCEPAGGLPTRPWWRDVFLPLNRKWLVPEITPQTFRDVVGEG